MHLVNTTGAVASVAVVAKQIHKFCLHEIYIINMWKLLGEIFFKYVRNFEFTRVLCEYEYIWIQVLLAINFNNLDYS